MSVLARLPHHRVYCNTSGGGVVCVFLCYSLFVGLCCVSLLFVVVVVVVYFVVHNEVKGDPEDGKYLL